MAGEVHMNVEEEKGMRFSIFRSKVRTAQVLSASTERLLREIEFSGRVTVVIQNGRVLKSGYEEGYFRQHVVDGISGD
jgi:hypothetical protein